VRLLASRPTPVNFGGAYDFLLGFTPLDKGSSFKALKTRPPSHSHLLHIPLCIAPGPPRGIQFVLLLLNYRKISAVGIILYNIFVDSKSDIKSDNSQHGRHVSRKRIYLLLSSSSSSSSLPHFYCPYRLCVPPGILANGYRFLYFGVMRLWRETNHFHLVQMFNLHPIRLRCLVLS
jgi:hypothetical protein